MYHINDKSTKKEAKFVTIKTILRVLLSNVIEYNIDDMK